MLVLPIARAAKGHVHRQLRVRLQCERAQLRKVLPVCWSGSQPVHTCQLVRITCPLDYYPVQMVEPVAGNYYPITAAAAVTDGCLTLGVATDRWDMCLTASALHCSMGRQVTTLHGMPQHSMWQQCTAALNMVCFCFLLQQQFACRMKCLMCHRCCAVTAACRAQGAASLIDGQLEVMLHR